MFKQREHQEHIPEQRMEALSAHLHLPEYEADGAFRSRSNGDLNNASSTGEMQQKIDQWIALNNKQSTISR
jgi:hypothetical protein